MPDTYGQGLLVTYASLDSASESLYNEAKNLRDDLDDIEAEVRAISQIWQGEAHEAYEATMKKWEKEVDGIHLNLLQIAEAVRRSKDGYQATDIKGRKYFDQYL